MCGKLREVFFGRCSRLRWEIVVVSFQNDEMGIHVSIFLHKFEMGSFKAPSKITSVGEIVLTLIFASFNHLEKWKSKCLKFSNFKPYFNFRNNLRALKCFLNFINNFVIIYNNME